MNKKVDILIALLFFFVVVFVGISVFKIITNLAPDFSVLYHSSKDLLQQKNPYHDKTLSDAFIYPVATGVVYLPFALLPYPYAQGLFVLLSVFAVPVIVYLLLQVMKEKYSWRHVLIFTSLAYLFFPVKFTFGMGQSNVIAALLLTGGYYFYRRKVFDKSGIFLALSYLIKPIFGVTVLYFITRKAWRVLRTLTVTTGVVVLLSVFVFGISLYTFYFFEIIPSLMNSNANAVYYNQSPVGFLARLGLEQMVIKWIATGINFFLLGYTLFLSQRKKIDTDILFAIFVTLIPLIHSLSWQHHFAVLIIPFVIVTMKIMKSKRYLLLVLLFFAYLLVGWNIKTPELYAIFPISLLLSHVFYGCLLLLGILFTLAREKKS